jgi:murein DD-endopeptidase MepM/ murein hydrolase activator NlpD
LKKHRRALAILLSGLWMTSTFPFPASAQSDDQTEFDAEKQSLAEQVLDLRLSDLPPTQEDIYSEDGSELLVRAGTPPEDFLTPFDMGWEGMTIDDIEQITGEDIGSLPVSSFPGLYEYWNSESKKRIKQNAFAMLLKPWRILEAPAIAQTTPAPSNVVPINSLPGVGNVQLQTITGPLGNPNPAVAGAASTTASGSAPPISIYPALASLPIISTILSVKDYFLPMDVAYTGGKFSDAPCDEGIECKESPQIDNATSGIWKKPFASCTTGKAEGDDCGHFEVRRRGGEAAQVHIRWMTKRHKESEGNFLCTKGPVGRHPFGPNPRYVAQSIKENGNIKKVNPFPSGDSKAEARFWLYFFVKGPPGFKSANCLGVPAPPPIDKAVEGGLVLHGLDNGSTNAAIQSLISGVQNPGESYGCTPGQTSSSGGGSGQPQQFQQVNQSDLVAVTSIPGRTEYLHRDAAASFEQMVQAAKNSGVNLYALSGYRSISAQQQVLANNPTSTQIAQPGQSEHHTGYAVDISNGDPQHDLQQSFQQQPAYQWLKANASKYGFSQSYGPGSPYGNEPWHWRWQGNATAQQVFNNASSSSTSSSQVSQNCSPQNLPAPTECPPGDRNFGWPANGTFTSGYGMRWGRMHWGIDVANGIGTPVVASLCGRLVFNQWDDSGFGNLYVVDHGDGWETFYAHNDQPSKLPIGSVVKRGEFLGPMGTTGRSTGPHTHFEIRHKGARLNPMDYLR